MPIDPKHLLDLANRLVGPAPGAPEADLRRGISTAYYALFHLLIRETMSNFVSDVAFRTKVGRAFQHGSMRSVCDKYNPIDGQESNVSRRGSTCVLSYFRMVRDRPGRLSCPDITFLTVNKPDKKTGEYIAQEGNGFPSQVIAPDVRMIAATFVALHEARETADYDDAATMQHTEALAAVQQVDQAFRAWLTVQTEPSAVTFLQELLFRSIIKR